MDRQGQAIHIDGSTWCYCHDCYAERIRVMAEEEKRIEARSWAGKNARNIASGLGDQ